MGCSQFQAQQAMKKVSTTKLADEYLSVRADVLWNALMAGGYIDSQKQITNAGIEAGGETKSFKGITYYVATSDFNQVKKQRFYSELIYFGTAQSSMFIA